jgi:site-specific recombinase XerD
VSYDHPKWLNNRCKGWGKFERLLTRSTKPLRRKGLLPNRHSRHQGLDRYPDELEHIVNERLITAFLAHWGTLGHASDTGRMYARCLERLAVPFAEITPLDLTEHLARRRETVSPASIAIEVRAFRAFFAWYADVYETPNPARALRTPKVDEPPVTSVNETDYRTLLATAAGAEFRHLRDGAILAVLWSTGMRRTEVARMEMAHIDLVAQMVHIPRTKTGRARTVGLSDEAVRYLRRYLKRRITHKHRRSPYLWLADKGPLSSDGMRQMIHDRAKEAGVHVTAHSFRRAVAERWLRGGGSESLLRQHAGWRSPAMVARYVRANAEKLAVEEHRRLLG